MSATPQPHCQLVITLADTTVITIDKERLTDAEAVLSHLVSTGYKLMTTGAAQKTAVFLKDVKSAVINILQSEIV